MDIIENISHEIEKHLQKGKLEKEAAKLQTELDTHAASGKSTPASRDAKREEIFEVVHEIDRLNRKSK